VLWRERYGCDLTLRTLPAEQRDLSACEAVLLIGDKVVGPRGRGFDQALDLGQAWREHTGLPFVFAVWAAPHGMAHPHDPTHRSGLREFLEAARDRGVARAAQIAEECGPRAGWQVEIARHYLTRCLRFRIDQRMVAGVRRFAESCASADLAPADGRILWPADLDQKPSRQHK
jgi:chorismate dehydratase